MRTTVYAAITTLTGRIARTADEADYLACHYTITWHKSDRILQVSVVPDVPGVIADNDVVATLRALADAWAGQFPTHAPLVDDYARPDRQDECSLGSHDVNGVVEVQSSSSEEPTAPLDAEWCDTAGAYTTRPLDGCYCAGCYPIDPPGW